MVWVQFSSSFSKRNVRCFLTINRVHRTLSRRCSLSGSTYRNYWMWQRVDVAMTQDWNVFVKNGCFFTLWVSSPWFSSGSHSVVVYIYTYQIPWYVSWSPLFGAFHRPDRSIPWVMLWGECLKRLSYQNWSQVGSCFAKKLLQRCILHTHMGGFLKMVIPNNHGKILLTMINYGGVLGVPPFKETPIYIYMHILLYYRLNVYI